MNKLQIKLCIFYHRYLRKSVWITYRTPEDYLQVTDIYNGRGPASSELLFRSDYFRLASGFTEMVSATSSSWYLERIVKFAEATYDPNMKMALKVIASREDADEAIRHRAAAIIDKVEDRRPVEGRIPATEQDKIRYAITLLAGTRLPQTAEILRLLRDNRTISKRYAVMMIGKFNLYDMAGEVADSLANPELCIVAANVIRSFGEKASDELTHLFMSSSGNRQLSRIVVKLMGNIHSVKVNEFIFSLLWSSAREVRMEASDILLKNGYIAGQGSREKIENLIAEIIGIITWDLSVKSCLENNGNDNLSRIISNEISEWRLFIQRLLYISGIISDVNNARKTDKNDGSERRFAAIDLISSVADDAVKKGLFILFNNIDDETRLRKLSLSWPVIRPDYESVMYNIINRDYNLISLWAKVTAIRYLSGKESMASDDSLVALLFSPLSILREESILVLKDGGNPPSPGLIERIPREYSLQLKKILDGSVISNELIYSRAGFLIKLFPGIPADELLSLSENIQFYSKREHIRLAGEEDYLLWIVSDARPTGSCYLLIESYTGGLHPESINENGFCYVLPLSALDSFILGFPGGAMEIYNYLDNSSIKIIGN